MLTESCIYNVFMSSVQLAGEADGDYIFRGYLAVPDDQLQLCCVAFSGRPHYCSRNQTNVCKPMVELAIPCHLLDESLGLATKEMVVHHASFLGYSKAVSKDDFLATDQVAVGGKTNMLIRDHASGQLDAIQVERACGLQNLVEPRPQHGASFEHPREPDISLPVGQQRVLLVRVTDDTGLVLPFLTDDHVQGWARAELFAGGFAGWKQAVQYLISQGVGIASAHAVECDETVAMLYCKSFDIQKVFVHPIRGLKTQCVGIHGILSPPCFSVAWRT